MVLSDNRKGMPRSIYVGFDPREAAGFMVAVNSARRRIMGPSIPIRGLELNALRDRGLYTRPHEIKDDGCVWDPISEAYMSTEFAVSRFLVPHLAREGWALFYDCDMLVLCDLAGVFRIAMSSPSYAVMCVKHQQAPPKLNKDTWTPVAYKMDKQFQQYYHRKNWSSFCLFNCNHPSNKALTVEMINTLPGRDLHAFCWLKDEEIGELPLRYNFLVGINHMTDLPRDETVQVAHFTQGTPDMPGYETGPFTDLWRMELRKAASRLHVGGGG